MAARRGEIALVIWQFTMSPAAQSTKSLKPPDTKHRFWIFCPSSLKRGRNGNPANPFASNSCNSNSTPRWRKPNAIRASGNANAISSRKLHLAFPHKLPDCWWNTFFVRLHRCSQNIECNRQSTLSLEIWSHVAKLISF